MQKRRGRSSIIYHVNDVSVNLGRDRGGEGSPIERMRLDLVVSAPSAGVLNVREAKSVPLLVKNEERVCEMRFFNQ